MHVLITGIGIDQGSSCTRAYSFAYQDKVLLARLAIFTENVSAQYLAHPRFWSN